MPESDVASVPKRKAGRPRKPESEKKTYVPTGGQRGRPRIHPPKEKSDRPRGRPRINPPKEVSNRPRGRPKTKVDEEDMTKPAKTTERKTPGKRGRPRGTGSSAKKQKT